MFIFVLPGLLFYVIVRSGTISGLAVENSKEVYGLMLKSLLPTGLFGVMAAALMAALMGNLIVSDSATERETPRKRRIV